MSAVSKTPTNVNFLHGIGSKLVLKRAPHLEFFCQEMQIPGIELPVVNQGTPYTQIKRPGDQMQFENLSLTYKVDEDLSNYLEMYNWMRSLADPVDKCKYADLAAGQSEGNGVESDISVFKATNLRNPNFEIIYRNAFPIALGSIQFESTSEETIYLNNTVTFAYTWFDIEMVT